MAVTQEQIDKYAKPSYIDEFTKKQAVTDDALEKVPAGKRRSFWQVLSAMLGFVIFPGGFMTGAVLAITMNTKAAIMAILIGNAIQVGISAASGWIGNKSGLTLYLIWKYCWGHKAFMFATVMFWLPYVLWVGVEGGMVGGFIDEAVTIGWHSTIGLWFVILAVIPAAFGFKWVAHVARVGVPLLLGLMIWGLVVGRGMTPVEPEIALMSLSAGIGLVVGTFAAGALATADFARYLKSPKQVFGISFLAFGAGQTFVMLVGFYLGQRVGEGWGLGTIFASLGLFIPGLIVILISLFTTIDCNAYSGGLQLTSLFGRWAKRWQLVMIHGAVAGIIATMGIYYSYLGFLFFLSALIPALGGVIFGDVISNWKQKYLGIKHWWHVGRAYNWIAIVSFISGAGLNALLFLRFPDVSYGGVFGLLTAMGVYVFVIKVLKRPDPILETYERDRHIIEEVERVTASSKKGA